MSQLVNLVGKRFGRLLAIKRDGSNKHGRALWICKCDCGQQVYVPSNKLQSNHTNSCGCLQKEIASKVHTKHRLIRTRAYKIWAGIIQRCTNLNNPSYYNYGGRGITVDETWKADFINFLNDMGHAPDNSSIERIDNNGPYTKDNCRWATDFDQRRNKRTSRILTLDGKTQCAADWATELDIAPSTLHYRLKHWPLEKALTTPTKK
jgi:hypothetical protein